MLTDFAFLACGSPFKGVVDVAYLFGALISLLLGSIIAIINLVLVCVLEQRRGNLLSWHLLGWFAYVGTGVATFFQFFSRELLSLAATATALIAITTIITGHFVCLIHVLCQSRKVPPAD